MYEDGLSPRSAAAQSLVETCLFGGLTDAFKLGRTRVTDKNGKTYWLIDFVSGGTLRIEIRVYTLTKIVISWEDSNAKVSGKQIFRNRYSAQDYICRAFVIR